MADLRLLHLGSRAGNPACRSTERIPRLTSDPRIVGCADCRESKFFNSTLRHWLLRQLRKNRPAPVVTEAACVN